MKYVIDEEELSKICQSLDWGKDTPLEMMNMIRELLKSKQPVEVLAEIPPEGKLIDLSGKMDSLNKQIYYQLECGNKVKIFIQMETP